MYGGSKKTKKGSKKSSSKIFKQTGSVKATANRIKKACSPSRMKA